MHSSLVAQRYRIKKTAKAKGYKEVIEKTNADKILNISEYIGTIGMAVQELPLCLDIATTISGVYNTVKYYLNEELVAQFGYEVPKET